MDIFFISSNANKRKEVCELLSSASITVHTVNLKIEEIQSVDMAKIVEDKALRGFKEVWRPVLVEQTGLLFKEFGGLPGGFTQIFWDTLKAEKFSRFFSLPDFRDAVAKSVFAYCDGQRIKVFKGETHGKIISPQGMDGGLSWDCVFVPDGHTLTLSEISSGANEHFSIRKAALNSFKDYLEGKSNGTGIV